MAVANRALPRPPRPPAATTTVAPCVSRSASSSEVSASWTTVPAGTRIRRPAPSRPCLRPPAPGVPFAARNRRRSRYSPRVVTPASATRTTSPPRPPSPPSGPPLGTYLSRLKLTAPRPPAPAVTSRMTSSRNRAQPCTDGLGGAAVSPGRRRRALRAPAPRPRRGGPPSAPEARER